MAQPDTIATPDPESFATGRIPSPSEVPVTVHFHPTGVTGSFYTEPVFLDPWRNAYSEIGKWTRSYTRRAAQRSIWEGQTKEEETLFGYDDLKQRVTMQAAANLSLIYLRSSGDYLKDACLSLSYPHFSHLAPLSLLRSTVDGSATALWLLDPRIDLAERLKRTSKIIVRSMDYSARMLLGEGPPITGPDSSLPIKTWLQEQTELVLGWVRLQGWRCNRGKEVTLGCWKREIPGFQQLVSQVSEEEPEAGRSLYIHLSGATHSDVLHAQLGAIQQLDQRPNIGFLVIVTRCYKRVLTMMATVMGWDDHRLEDWFAPVLDAMYSQLPNIRDHSN